MRATDRRLERLDPFEPQYRLIAMARARRGLTQVNGPPAGRAYMADGHAEAHMNAGELCNREVVFAYRNSPLVDAARSPASSRSTICSS